MSNKESIGQLLVVVTSKYWAESLVSTYSKARQHLRILHAFCLPFFPIYIRKQCSPAILELRFSSQERPEFPTPRLEGFLGCINIEQREDSQNLVTRHKANLGELLFLHTVFSWLISYIFSARTALISARGEICQHTLLACALHVDIVCDLIYRLSICNRHRRMHPGS